MKIALLLILGVLLVFFNIEMRGKILVPKDEYIHLKNSVAVANQKSVEAFKSDLATEQKLATCEADHNTENIKKLLIIQDRQITFWREKAQNCPK